jgi:hypothetical protein
MHFRANGNAQKQLHFSSCWGQLHACGPSNTRPWSPCGPSLPADCASRGHFGATGSTRDWVILGARARRAGETCFSTTFDTRRNRAHCDIATETVTQHQIPDQRLGWPRSRVCTAAAMCRSSRSTLILVRIEATPLSA